MMLRSLALGLALTVLASAAASAQKTGEPLAIFAGKVLTMDARDTVHDNAVVFVRDRKIERIVPIRDVEVPEGYRIVEARDRWLLPGLIDPHNHTATDQRGSLLSEYPALTNPGLRAWDLVETGFEDNKRSLAGGVTTALLIPGSATNMGGFGVVVRLGADDPDDLITRGIGSIKIAQAGNPERFYFAKGRSYMNYNLRQTMRKALDYHEAWSAWESGEGGEKPSFNAHWDLFRGLFRREYPASVHTQMFQVVSKTLTMLNDEFGIRVMIDHGTFDGYKAATLAHDRDVHAMIGPRVFWMDPADGTMNGCAGEYWERGFRKLGLNTDAGVLPQEDLVMQGAMGVRFGWKTYPALKGMTYWAADSLGLLDRIGSIEPGKDADLVIWSGDPLDFRSGVDRVYVLGKLAYDADERRIY